MQDRNSTLSDVHGSWLRRNRRTVEADGQMSKLFKVFKRDVTDRGDRIAFAVQNQPVADLNSIAALTPAGIR